MTARNDHAAFADQLVAACLDEADRFTRNVVARVCEENPREAASLQRRYEALRASGLVGPAPIEGAAPDPWSDGAREALSDPDAARKYDAVGPYQPLKELGRGGQAVVFLAEDLRLHRPVALKVLKGLGPLSETVMNRFRREAEVASKLDHPGICAVFDAGVHDGVPYIAMRFIAGETLGDRIAAAKGGTTQRADGSISVGSRTKAEINRLLALLEKAARAIHVAHEAGIVHRDVKPGNIMVTPSNEPVILDFGLAGDEEGGLVTLTETGDMLGTPAYMSPEQLMANRLRLDRRTDVYSLGVTLFECLTLERPFTANTRDAMYQAIQYKDPTDVRSLNPALPADLKVVIDTALEKDRDRRYQTAEDFAEDLRRVRANEPISARPVSAVGRALRWAKRRPMRAALLAVLIVGIPALTALTGHVIANRPAVREAERQAFLAEVERHLEEGYAELAHRDDPKKAGDPEKAIASFDAALALKADSGEAIGGKALALYRAEDHAGCLTFVEQHADVEGTEWALRHIRIDVLRKLGRTGEADDLARDQATEPRTALGFFLAGQRLMQGCQKQTDMRVFRSALDYFTRAALTATHARQLYHLELGHAAQHLEDKASARQAAGALQTVWPESYLANRRAARALSAVDTTAAIAAYRKVIELKPDDANNYLNLGGLLQKKGQLDDAIAACRKAIEVQPDFAEAHASLGIALEANGQFDEAVAASQKAVGLKPDARNYDVLGAALRAKGQFDEAIVAYRKAVELKSDYAEAYYNLGGVLCEDKRDFDAAIQAFEKAIELKPNYAEAYSNLGRALAGKGQPDEAIAAFKKAIELKPDSAHAYTALAEALQHKGQYDDALAACRKAIELDPDFAAAYFNLSAALMMKGQIDEAIAALEKVIEQKPGFAKDYLQLGIALARKGQFNEAIASLEKAIELKPNLVEAHSNLGKFLASKGQFDEAIAACERAVELNANSARAHGDLGIVLLHAGRTVDGIAACKRAIELKPDLYNLAHIYLNLGASYATEGQFDEAIVACKRAIELLPNLFQAHYNLANALSRKGQLDEAIAAFEKAIELRPDVGQIHCNLGHALRQQGHPLAALVALRKGHVLGSARAGWPYRSGQWLRDCEAAVLREAQHLVGKGGDVEDVDAWFDAAEALEALVAGWRADFDREDRKSVVATWLKALGREPWSTLRDPAACKGLPAAEYERWRKIWTDVDELAQRLQAKK